MESRLCKLELQVSGFKHATAECCVQKAGWVSSCASFSVSSSLTSFFNILWKQFAEVHVKPRLLGINNDCETSGTMNGWDDWEASCCCVIFWSEGKDNLRELQGKWFPVEGKTAAVGCFIPNPNWYITFCEKMQCDCFMQNNWDLLKKLKLICVKWKKHTGAKHKLKL